MYRTPISPSSTAGASGALEARRRRHVDLPIAVLLELVQRRGIEGQANVEHVAGGEQAVTGQPLGRRARGPRPTTESATRANGSRDPALP